MQRQVNPSVRECPVTSNSVLAESRDSFENLAKFCQTCDSPFWMFEKEFFIRIAVLAAFLIRLFLTARHERLDVQPFLRDGRYRFGDDYAERKLKTRFGQVRYGRRYLQSQRGESGIFPLDIELGLTRDRMSPWMMQWVALLATRMSFKASRMVCRAVLNWAPATETIEQVVLGMGREAAPFMRQLKAPKDDGEMLVIEVDGKCPPTATAEELAKRRGKRKPKHEKSCQCGCQRHRGRAKREARGSKKRRKRGDKSKNGKEVTVVVIYTLKQGGDGQMHGPFNKKLYATFAGRKAAILWARAEATKRGFGPETTKTVQIVTDGAQGLMDKLKPLFPKAIFTLDVCHVVEKLWALGHHYHKEGSEELKDWVDELKEMVYGGKAEKLVRHLKRLLDQVPIHGPGTVGRRKALKRLIGYLKKRLDLMRYDEWIKKDFVIASGQVEGAVRHLVGERFDCAGMRWIQGKAEALLHLRCIELNGDWQKFATWFQGKTLARLKKGERHKILTDKPLTVKKAA
jgi:uncharacterized protein UPF0236